MESVIKISDTMTPFLEHRIDYRRKLQRMTDYQVYKLFLALSQEDFVQDIIDSVTGKSRRFSIPMTISSARDEKPEYYLGIGSLDELSALEEEVQMRQAVPRCDSSLRSRLARFIGGYV